MAVRDGGVGGGTSHEGGGDAGQEGASEEQQGKEGNILLMELVKMRWSCGCKCDGKCSGRLARVESRSVRRQCSPDEIAVDELFRWIGK